MGLAEVAMSQSNLICGHLLLLLLLQLSDILHCTLWHFLRLLLACSLYHCIAGPSLLQLKSWWITLHVHVTSQFLYTCTCTRTWLYCFTNIGTISWLLRCHAGKHHKIVAYQLKADVDAFTDVTVLVFIWGVEDDNAATYECVMACQRHIPCLA